MVAVQLVLEADFDKDGTYETDLSAYLTERAGGARIVRGASVQGEPREGVMQVTLDNELGTFTLDYDSSPLYGQLEPHVPLRLRGLLNGVPFVAYTGYVSRYRPQYGAKGENIAEVEAKDLTAHLSAFPLVNINAAERTTSEAYEAIADALGIGQLVDADPGLETLPLHYCRNANAMDALTHVTWSEMGGDQYVTADGTLRQLNRHARLGIYEVAHEWGTGTLVQPEKVDPELTDDDLITSAAVQGTLFVADDPTVVLFVFSRGKDNPTPDSLFLAANVPYVVQLDFPSPVLSIVEPEADRDYLANSAIDGSGTDQTSSLSVTAELQGAGFELTLVSTTDTYVTFMQLRGLAENEAVDRPVFTHTLSLPNQIMDQGVTLQVPFASDTQTLRDYPVAVSRTYRWPYPVVHLDFAWDTEAVALSMLETELWDLVHFTDTGPAEWLTHIDDFFYVVGISHELVPGRVFRSKMTLVPAHLYFDLDAIAYDNFQRDAASGALGTALSGDAWSNDSGFDIASGAAVPNSDSESTPYVRLFDATDQVVETQISGMAGNDEAGITFRYESPLNHYRAYVDHGSSEVVLEAVVGGVVTEIASPAWVPTAFVEMRAIIQDTRIRVWVGRRKYIDTTDGSWAAGYRAGLFARNASGTARFNHFHGRGI